MFRHRRWNDRFAREVLEVDPREVPVTDLAEASVTVPGAAGLNRAG